MIANWSLFILVVARSRFMYCDTVFGLSPNAFAISQSLNPFPKSLTIRYCVSVN